MLQDSVTAQKSPMLSRDTEEEEEAAGKHDSPSSCPLPARLNHHPVLQPRDQGQHMGLGGTFKNHKRGMQEDSEPPKATPDPLP